MTINKAFGLWALLILAIFVSMTIYTQELAARECKALGGKMYYPRRGADFCAKNGVTIQLNGEQKCEHTKR